MTPQEFINRVYRESGVLPVPAVLPYGTKIGKYLTVGVDHLASSDTGGVSILAATSMLFDEARELYGRPIRVTAGFRTHAHEMVLRAAGYKTAKFVSPHSVGAALDCEPKVLDGQTQAAANIELQTIFVKAAAKLGYPVPRLGHKLYGEKFTHVDVVFFLFSPFTALAHPSEWPDLNDEQRVAFNAWKPGISW